MTRRPLDEQELRRRLRQLSHRATVSAGAWERVRGGERGVAPPPEPELRRPLPRRTVPVLAAGLSLAVMVGVLTLRSPDDSATLVLGPSARSPFPGTGHLAVVQGGRLRLIDAERRRAVVPDAPKPTLPPAWSPDGRWVAMVAEGDLWLVSSDGNDVRRLTRGFEIGEFAWSPARPRLAVADLRSGWDLVLVPLDGPPRPLVHHDAGGARSFLWAPDGTRIAFTVPPTTEAAGGSDGVSGVIVETGAQQVLLPPARDATEALVLGAWWRTGDGLLFWRLPERSASLAADGAVLYSRSLTDGEEHALATTLLDRRWLSWSPDGSEVALVEGGSRRASETKRLAICPVPSPGPCRRLPLPPGRVALDPAWSPEGRLAFVQAAEVPGGPSDAAAWLATRQLWVVDRDGSGARAVPGAARGAQRPEWSRDGSSVAYAGSSATSLFVDVVPVAGGRARRVGDGFDAFDSDSPAQPSPPAVYAAWRPRR